MQHIRTSHICAKCHRNLNKTVFSFGPSLPSVLLPLFHERELIGLNVEPVSTFITDRKTVLSESKAWLSNRLPKLKGETRAGSNSTALMFCI